MGLTLLAAGGGDCPRGGALPFCAVVAIALMFTVVACGSQSVSYPARAVPAGVLTDPTQIAAGTVHGGYMLEIRYVYEWPVRITHWVNVFSILMLSITGFYIGNPFMAASETSQYIMGWVRLLHFSFAYLFTVSVVSRIIWMFLGNHHASWKVFFLWTTAAGRHSFVKMFRYYTFTGKQISYEVGHNPVAAMAYLGVFCLFVFQIVSGFALYGQFAPGGFWNGLTGWLLTLVGSQWLRLAHHGAMWLLAGFFINHIYSAWLMDVKERNGTISGIFSGYKYIEPKDL